MSVSEDSPGTDWKSYEDFAAGIDGNRLPTTDALAGEAVGFPIAPSEALAVSTAPAEVVSGRLGEPPSAERLSARLGEPPSAERLSARLDEPPPAERLSLRLGRPPSVEWESGGTQSTGTYEAIALGDDAYFLDLLLDGRPHESVTAIVSLRTGRTLSVRSQIADAPVPDEPRVRQSFAAGALDGRALDPGSPVPAPTRDLIGRRNLYRYSPDHLYEHTYLSSERYCWQCLEGVERGLADCDMATTYRFDEHRYLLAFREFRLEVASVLVLDMQSMRSTGKFFGLTDSGEVQNEPAGARIIPLSETTYPDGVAPI